MKLQRILFVALSLSFLTAGNSAAQTINFKTTEYWEAGNWCNNEYEIISGQFDVHYLLRINKSIAVDWYKVKFISGEAVSNITGEIFKVTYFWKEDPFLPGIEPHRRSFQINMVGDKGTHIIVAMTLEDDLEGNTFVVKFKDKCF